MTTPIIYYGGKTTMLQHIIPIIPEHNIYSEVFFGGGAVFFAKRKAANETINDKLGIVVNFYRTLKRDYKRLKGMIDETLMSREQFEKARLIMKQSEWFSDLEKAWAFWIITNFSYSNKIGGGFKYSKDKGFTPAALMKKKKAEFTDALVRRIEDANIECADALWVLNKRDCKESFHFIDPPYCGSDQGHYRGWTETNEAELLETISHLKGKFILSNNPTPGVLASIEKNGWWSKQFKIQNAGVKAKNRAKVEILVANFTPIGAHTLPFEN